MKKEQRLSLMIWCLICVFVIFVLLPGLVIDRNRSWEDQRPPAAALAEWEVGFGPEMPAPDGWTVLDMETRASLSGYQGTVWLQHELPELNWGSPYLYFSWLNRFEAFIEDESLYRYNMEEPFSYSNAMKLLHPIQISLQSAGKPLLIRAEWEGASLFSNDLVLIGEPDQVMLKVFRAELSLIMVAILAVVAGVVGFVFFVRRKEALYGWFALFCLSMGLTLLFSCQSLQWVFDMQNIYYWHGLIPPAAIWAGTGFYSSVLNISHWPLVRRVHYFMIFYISLLVITAVLFPHLFFSYVFLSYTIASFAGFVIGAVALVFYLRHAKRGEDSRWLDMEQERRWLFRGFWTFSICMTVSLMLSLFPNFLVNLLTAHKYVYKVLEALIANSVLLFIICMVMVMIARVRRVHLEAERNAAELLVKNKELEQFHYNLERLVEQRTSELENANRVLAVTLREKAETLAEMSVLEERNRISYEMHDVVGHTLTAAIVQLEATKKLASREGEVPLEKLDLLSELVRKGLNDIRKAVRLMTSDEEQPLPLTAALQELIQYTEDTMEIKVESDISLPPGFSLGRVVEGVLYHALQEGLTNGIRHGRSSRFHFTLHKEGEMLLFKLVNDGEPFDSESPGFGLTSMMDRVELLGGKVSVHPYKAADGSPVGCKLSIAIPLSR